MALYLSYGSLWTSAHIYLTKSVWRLPVSFPDLDITVFADYILGLMFSRMPHL